MSYSTNHNIHYSPIRWKTMLDPLVTSINRNLDGYTHDHE